MNNFRKNAIIVGVLFIIATVLGVLGRSFSQPILDAPDYLIKMSANENQVIIGGLLVLLSAFASAGIAIGLYPVLKKHHEALALGSVGLRVMEGMLYIVGVVGLLSILALSQEYVKAGASNASLFQASGTSLLAVRDWAGKLSIIAFTLGALMYYYVFYQSKLVPRWLSGWGLVVYPLLILGSILTMFHLIIVEDTIWSVLVIPAALQEMVLAFWLIIKGFNPSAIASVSAKTDMN